MEVPAEVEFDFTLTSTIAEAVLNGPGEWIGDGVELAALASVVREKVKPLIAARVRAEADDQQPCTTCEEPTGNPGSFCDACKLSDIEDECDRLRTQITRVRAEERQRLTGGLSLVLEQMRRTNFWEIGRESWLGVEREIEAVAAGSAVPVATPTGPIDEPEPEDKRPDSFRLAEWRSLPDECFIQACDADSGIDQRGPVLARGGLMRKACTEHWEGIFRVLGEQATWERTDGFPLPAEQDGQR